MDEYTPKYLPGFEPDDIKPLVDSFFDVINRVFPDKVVVRNEWNHQWDNAANMLCRKLGYINGKDFLEAYGYRITDVKSNTIPITESIQIQVSDASPKSLHRFVPEEYNVNPKAVKISKKKWPVIIASFLIAVIVIASYLCFENGNFSFEKKSVSFTSKQEMIDTVKGVYSHYYKGKITSQIIVTENEVTHSRIIVAQQSDILNGIDSDITYEIWVWNYEIGTFESRAGLYTVLSNGNIEYDNDVYVQDKKKIIPLNAEETVDYFNNSLTHVTDLVDVFDDTLTFFDGLESTTIEEIQMQEKKYIEQERIIQNEIDFLNMYAPNQYYNHSWNYYEEYLNGLIPSIKSLQNLNPNGDEYYDGAEIYAVLMEASETILNKAEFEKVLSECNSDDSKMRYATETAETAIKFTNVEIEHNSSYTVCTGTVTNVGQHLYRFVTIKGGFTDSNGKVVDTDDTYAVGKEGLSPGESCTFRMSVPRNISIKKCAITIIDYDME